MMSELVQMVYEWLLHHRGQKMIHAMQNEWFGCVRKET